MTEDQQKRIVEALCAADSELRDRAVDMLATFLLDRRVAELVDVGATVDVFLAALNEDNVSRIVAEHLSPAWERHRKRCEEASEKLQDGFPPDARDALVEIFAEQRLPEARWAEGAIDPAVLKELLAPVLQDTLIAFAKRVLRGDREGDEGPIGSLAGRLGRRAGRLASAGKSAFGGLGAELDKRMAAAAREFSGTAQRQLRESMQQRLSSDRGRELATELRRQLLQRIFETDVAVLMGEVETLPRAELEKLVGPIIAHNAARSVTRSALEQELRAFLDREGSRTISDLFAELGVADPGRAALRATLDALARELFASRPFATWLADVLRV